MANDIFVDTSGFYALLVKGDDRHTSASRILRESGRHKRGFVTTDYVLDEMAALMKVRGFVHVLGRLFDTIENSQACRIEWTDAGRFRDVRTFFLKHADQAWSFTDCLSFRVMKELRLRDALTKDGHFHEAGFVALLK